MKTGGLVKWDTPQDAKQLRSVMKKTGRSLTGLIVEHQTPLIEGSPDDMLGTRWRIWLSYDREVGQGTYLVLKLDGSIERHTLMATGEVVNVITVQSPRRR